MRRIGAGAHHLGERRLFQPAIAVVEETFGGRHHASKLLRHDHIPKPQTGAERAREGAEMDRTIRRVRDSRIVVQLLDDGGIVGYSFDLRHSASGERVDEADFTDREGPHRAL
jgi:hypothetical protein